MDLKSEPRVLPAVGSEHVRRKNSLHVIIVHLPQQQQLVLAPGVGEEGRGGLLFCFQPIKKLAHHIDGREWQALRNEVSLGLDRATLDGLQPTFVTTREEVVESVRLLPCKGLDESTELDLSGLENLSKFRSHALEYFEHCGTVLVCYGAPEQLGYEKVFVGVGQPKIFCSLVMPFDQLPCLAFAVPFPFDRMGGPQGVH